jgi:hypothetical protein
MQAMLLKTPQAAHQTQVNVSMMQQPGRLPLGNLKPLQVQAV